MSFTLLLHKMVKAKAQYVQCWLKRNGKNGKLTAKWIFFCNKSVVDASKLGPTSSFNITHVICAIKTKCQ